MRMENGPLLQRKMGKGVCVKKGALIRGGKGKGPFWGT